MRTFTGSFNATFRLVCTDEFVAQMRADAQSEGSTAFLRAAHDAHPVNDEAFIEMVLKNGVKSSVRINLLELIANSSGLGGNVSPVKVEIVGIPVDAADPHVEPQVVEVERKAALRPELAAPYGFTEPVHDAEGSYAG